MSLHKSHARYWHFLHYIQCTDWNNLTNGVKMCLNSVYFKSSLLVGQELPTTTLSQKYILTNCRSFFSQFNKHSDITDAMQTKGAIYYATLQGYTIFKRTCTCTYNILLVRIYSHISDQLNLFYPKKVYSYLHNIVLIAKLYPLCSVVIM